MIRLSHLIAAAMLTAPAMAHATPCPMVPRIAPATADQLAELLVPEEAMVELVLKSARGQAAQMPRFAGKPQLIYYVLERLRPEIEAAVRETLPELRGEVAAIIAAEMTPDQIEDVHSFFVTPTGRRLQSTTYEVMGENPLADPETVKALAVRRFMASMTPADLEPLRRFGTSAGAQRMQGLNPRIGAASEAWGTRLLERHGARFDTLREAAIRDYEQQNPGVAQ